MAAGMGISETQAMHAGVARAMKVAEIHGITSQQVMDCLLRWSGIIGDIRATKGAV